MRNINQDKHGAIIHRVGSYEDAGDAVNWTGHFTYFTGIVLLPLKLFEKGFGGYVRHFDPEMTGGGTGAYYLNPWNANISRDQLTGIIGWIIKTKDYWAMVRLILHHFCWLFLFAYNTIQNGKDPKTADWKWPDITLFDIWSMELRGFGWFSWIFWPLLCILDLQMLVEAIIANNQDREDVISFTLTLCISREYVPTPTSWLTFQILDKKELLEEIKKYWCGDRNNCGMYELYEDKLKELAA